MYIFLSVIYLYISQYTVLCNDTQKYVNGHLMKFEDSTLLNNLQKYEIFSPIFIPSNEESLIFELKTKSRNYEVHLLKNDIIFHPDISLSYFNKNNEEIEYQTWSDNCYYQGYVTGYPDISVTASDCDGLRGALYIPIEGTLLFESFNENSNDLVLYRVEDVIDESDSHLCMELPPENNTMLLDNNLLGNSMSDILKRSKRSASKKYLELLITVDYDLYIKHSRDLKSIYNRVKELTNYMDGYYQKLGVRVVLLHVEVWSNGNKIDSDTNAINVLNAFLDYRKVQMKDKASKWARTDNAQLLYGSDFAGSTVGMAPVLSMCGFRSGGVNMDHKPNVHHTAATMAHEMGHNFGMSHDTSDCSCNSNGGCVMSSKAGFQPPSEWSSCSKEYFERGLQQGTGVCLLNVPRSEDVFGGPSCGNGLVEKGEECDCGLPRDCISKCCNASTCQLNEGAKCDEGVCCSLDCEFSSPGTECRPTSNLCDLPEYCTGNSAFCPLNVYKMDGHDCGTEGMCYDGTCREHNKQCEMTWGKGAVMSDPYCYKRINSLGDGNGNCGMEPNGKFRKCTEENSQCGKLICTGGNDRPIIGQTRVAYRNRISEFVCKTLSSPVNSTDAESGMVQDGTKCGDGQTCFNGVCQDKSILSMSTLTPLCAEGCNGNGICNNKGNCHCEARWAPPDCLNSGNGGSVDSGPVTPPTIGMEVILILVMFLIVLPICLGIITWVWWKYCGGREKYVEWRSRRDEMRTSHPRGATNNTAGKITEIKMHPQPSPIVKKKPTSAPPPVPPPVNYTPTKSKNIPARPAPLPTDNNRNNQWRPSPPMSQPPRQPALATQNNVTQPVRSAPAPPPPPTINKPSPVPPHKPSPVFPPKPSPRLPPKSYAAKPPSSTHSSDTDEQVGFSIKDRIKMMENNRI